MATHAIPRACVPKGKTVCHNREHNLLLLTTQHRSDKVFTGYGNIQGERVEGKDNEKSQARQGMAEKEKIQSYRDLVAYRKAYDLALKTYEVTSQFPKEELCGLVSQLRRAAVSVPSNIAEGYQRGSRKEYIQFLSIANGSVAELETQLSLSKDLKMLPQERFVEVTELCQDVSRLLHNLIRSLKQK